MNDLPLFQSKSSSDILWQFIHLAIPHHRPHKRKISDARIRAQRSRSLNALEEARGFALHDAADSCPDITGIDETGEDPRRRMKTPSAHNSLAWRRKKTAND